MKCTNSLDDFCSTTSPSIFKNVFSASRIKIGKMEKIKLRKSVP